MKLTKNKLKEMIRKELNLTEVKHEKWVVWIGQGSSRDRKLMKVAKSRRAALIYYNKLVNSDKYDELGMESAEHWNRTNKPKVEEGKLNEDKLKPAFAKKAKDVIEKVLGTNVEYDGENVFTAKGKKGAEAPLGTIFIDYYKHPLYGDTFEIFSTMSGVTGTEKAENSRDALKALIKFTKKNKRTFLK